MYPLLKRRPCEGRDQHRELEKHWNPVELQLRLGENQPGEPDGGNDGNGVCLLVEETEGRPSVPVPAKCCRLPQSPTRECCQPEFEEIHHKKY